MIINEYQKHKLICDNCMEEIEFDTFEEALGYKKKYEWQTISYEGYHEDYCPKCQE